MNDRPKQYLSQHPGMVVSGIEELRFIQYILKFGQLTMPVYSMENTNLKLSNVYLLGMLICIVPILTGFIILLPEI
jgi:hypothetical protein